MSEQQEKEIQYYSAAVNTWFATRLEHDKHLLTLSAGGIGLLVTLLTAIGVKSAEAFVLYTLAIVSFVVCVVIVLAIFTRNSEHIEKIITDNATEDPLLRLLDKLAKFSFILGVVLTAILGISIAMTSLYKENTMTKETKKTQNTTLRESVNGAAQLKPKERKSIEGAGKLRPSNQGNSASNKKDE
ncbi:MAG: hypothetical protein P8163_16290 [Candidatus Thiodiazotropha sp.]